MSKQHAKSLKLPVLIALVAVLVLAGVGAFFLLPDDPPPQPRPPVPLPESNDPDPGHPPDTDPLTADPNARPRPKPKPGAPDRVDIAQAMENEVREVLDQIRARLELKFKYAEYQLDPTWTLEQIMRRLERLDGEYFKGTDYALELKNGDEPTAEISCVSINGLQLADGPLRMTLNLRTGKSEMSGRIVARDTSGRVLLPNSAYAQLTNIIESAALSHAGMQRNAESGKLASFENVMSPWRPDPFVLSDFTAGPVAGRELTAEFACRTIQGEELAEPAVMTVDYATKKITISPASAPAWMPVPKDREQFKEDCRWALRAIAMRLARDMKNRGASEPDLSKVESVDWFFSSIGVLPFELRVDAAPDAPGNVGVEISTNFGRPLPFKRLRYVAQLDGGQGDYAD
ncbi:MAG: hypothetical protein H6839_06870 [Planctomycetes bacterium]|nr:hypothetical protein [Planctomycetota bacterium]